MATHPNDPAFPSNLPQKDPWGNIYYDHYSGMTMRQAFAMHALQAILTNGNYESPYKACRKAVEIADTLLIELNATESTKGTSTTPSGS